jgi:glycosyltransferase involved in cell wall biosynthesis
MLLTVFTPAYNRADLLVRCYDSMKRQTCKDFIWMIIDDGSTDGTQELVKQWISKESDFTIEYYYKENGGLHTAYNEAIAHISTELCVCIDSDDFMPDDAVKKITSFWKENGSNNVAGIVGLDYDLDDNIIGDPLPNQKTVNLINLLVGKYPIHNGDRTNVVRTELYKKFAPMKVFPGEKNFNPHYMHLQISQQYDFLVLNENLRYVEYQPTGMSNSMLKQYRNSPNSFAEIRKLYLSFPDTSFKFKLRHSIHLVSSCILAGKPWKAIKDSPCKMITIMAIPCGVVLAIYVTAKGR